TPYAHESIYSPAYLPRATAYHPSSTNSAPPQPPPRHPPLQLPSSPPLPIPSIIFLRDMRSESASFLLFISSDRKFSSRLLQTEGARLAREAVTADNPGATRLCLCFIPLLPRHGNLLSFLTILLVPGTEAHGALEAQCGLCPASPHRKITLTVASQREPWALKLRRRGRAGSQKAVLFSTA
ncbi:hypothetical protein KUCAC02_029307, partial [Chaenocephalus aceratus]